MQIDYNTVNNQLLNDNNNNNNNINIINDNIEVFLEETKENPYQLNNNNISKNFKYFDTNVLKTNNNNKFTNSMRFWNELGNISLELFTFQIEKRNFEYHKLLRSLVVILLLSLLS